MRGNTLRIGIVAPASRIDHALAEQVNALAAAQYRRCLADPLLAPVFGPTADPEHVARLAIGRGAHQVAALFGPDPRLEAADFQGSTGFVERTKRPRGPRSQRAPQR